MQPSDITLVNCYEHVRSTDDKYDSGHGSQHCLDVWRRILRCYNPTPGNFTRAEELLVLEASALFHEQGDTKFGQDLSENEGRLREAMSLDHIPIYLQDAVIELIGNCSFKKRHLWSGGENLNGLMDLLCGADLAEAVDKNALPRAYGFHRRRIAKKHGIPEIEVDPRDIWKSVREFYYLVGADGYQARMAAIRVQKIRDELKGCVEHNDFFMANICQAYHL